jgi:hypothetical protein
MGAYAQAETVLGVALADVPQLAPAPAPPDAVAEVGPVVRRALGVLAGVLAVTAVAAFANGGDVLPLAAGTVAGGAMLARGCARVCGRRTRIAPLPADVPVVSPPLRTVLRTAFPWPLVVLTGLGVVAARGGAPILAAFTGSMIGICLDSLYAVWRNARRGLRILVRTGRTPRGAPRVFVRGLPDAH